MVMLNNDFGEPLVCDPLYLVYVDIKCPSCSQITRVGALAAHLRRGVFAPVVLITRIWMLTQRTIKAVEKYRSGFEIGRGSNHAYYVNSCTQCHGFIDNGDLSSAGSLFHRDLTTEQSLRAAELHPDMPGEVCGESSQIDVGAMVEEGITRRYKRDSI